MHKSDTHTADAKKARTPLPETDLFPIHRRCTLCVAVAHGFIAQLSVAADRKVPAENSITLLLVTRNVLVATDWQATNNAAISGQALTPYAVSFTIRSAKASPPVDKL